MSIQYSFIMHTIVHVLFLHVTLLLCHAGIRPSVCRSLLLLLLVLLLLLLHVGSSELAVIWHMRRGWH